MGKKEVLDTDGDRRAFRDMVNEFFSLCVSTNKGAGLSVEPAPKYAAFVRGLKLPGACAPPDIVEQARAAIFWKEIAGIRLVNAVELGRMKADFKESVLEGLFDAIRRSGMVLGGAEELLEIFGRAWPVAAISRTFVGTMLVATLFYGGEDGLAPKKFDIAKVEPLLQLFAQGVWCIGFDANDRLIILAQESRGSNSMAV